MSFSKKIFFTIGIIIGVVLAIYFELLKREQPNNQQLSSSLPLNFKYSKWLETKNVKRRFVNIDQLRYGTEKYKTEAQYLFDQVNVLCLVLVHKINHADAVNLTWGQNCNKIVYYSLPNLKNNQKNLFDIISFPVNSSWNLLCETLHIIVNRNYKFNWILLVNDDSFVILENLRLFLAPLNSSEPHYLGHAITFWGVQYNMAQSSYVLSEKSVDILLNEYNSTEKCKRGGKFWKQQDFYLGKNLFSLGIRPEDTRDENGFSRFHGYNLYNLFDPGSLTTLANYYKYSIYPVKCCSRYSITFQTIDADKMIMYYYLLYKVQVFLNGQIGNEPYKGNDDYDETWKKFLRKHNISNYNISAEQYYDLWKSEVGGDADEFNAKLRNSYKSSKNNKIDIKTGIMPAANVLDIILNNYLNKTKNN